jgi:hypothetical protein
VPVLIKVNVPVMGRNSIPYLFHVVVCIKISLATENSVRRTRKRASKNVCCLGDQKCSVSCVEDSMSIPATRIHLDFGGSDLSQVGSYCDKIYFTFRRKIFFISDWYVFCLAVRKNHKYYSFSLLKIETLLSIFFKVHSLPFAWTYRYLD